MKIKRRIFSVILLIVLTVVIPIKVEASTGDSVEVSTLEEFLSAVENSTGEIKLAADIDLSKAGVLDVTGRTINLNNNKISTTNMGFIFEGSNFIVKNGKIDSKGGAYALFIGDEGGTNNVVVENVTITGGINVYNATNVVLKNVDVTGTRYYAVWCDYGGQVTIKNGTYRSNGVAVLGLVKNEGDSKLIIKGGNFVAEKKDLVLKNYGIPTISGGIFDVPINEEYCADGFKPATLDNNKYGVACIHKKTLLKDEKSETCASTGYTGDTYCSVCGEMVKTGTEIPKKEHIPSEWKYDSENHWKECTNKECGGTVIGNKQLHVYKGDICNICSYEQEKIKSVVNNKTNIKLEFSNAVVADNIYLDVSPVLEGEVTYTAVKNILPDVEKLVIFDINLMQNEVKIQPRGKVTISIPIPDSFDKSKLVVYRIEEQNKIEYEVKVVAINNKSYAQFKTDHFSNYVLAESKVKNIPQEVLKDESSDKAHKLDNEPKTGVMSSDISIGLVLTVSLIGYIISRKKIYK